jgi:hypothetical protein
LYTKRVPIGSRELSNVSSASGAAVSTEKIDALVVGVIKNEAHRRRFFGDYPRAGRWFVRKGFGFADLEPETRATAQARYLGVDVEDALVLAERIEI